MRIVGVDASLKVDGEHAVVFVVSHIDFLVR
jgi:hypothetical protein